jgi:transcriptional regulator with XRE-family HTH domain
MDRDGPSSTKNVAARLTLTREALGLSQAEICRRSGIAKSAWNNAETADNRLSLNDAIKLWEAFEIDLRWTFLGKIGGLPHDLAKKVEKLMAKGRV